ncbi:unnamed protein product [Phytophthora fragariaefolia]|uniref:Unnamed protein product n=1 Tax=Phytophthora fragariaefolia TaxID=1490495 RepID=A0A9W7CLB5_9STRA|nr:unnamed protein product [Phytophthora fragariaefolia]
MTNILNDFAKCRAEDGMKPARICHAMIARFDLDENSLPSLSQVQAYVHYYTKTKLHRHDTYNKIAEQVKGLKGSDDDPFLVLLRNFNHDPSTFVFHMDATFKLNQVDYPVLVCGISDKSRTFHIVALFITSQRREQGYTHALASLRRAYTDVTGLQLKLKWVMGDAEDAQYMAFENVFAVDSSYKYLMCFYHVMTKIQEKRRE